MGKIKQLSESSSIEIFKKYPEVVKRLLDDANRLNLKSLLELLEEKAEPEKEDIDTDPLSSVPLPWSLSFKMLFLFCEFLILTWKLLSFLENYHHSGGSFLAKNWF